MGLIILDCPSKNDVVTLAAVRAADLIICPVMVDLFSLAGLQDTARLIEIAGQAQRHRWLAQRFGRKRRRRQHRLPRRSRHPRSSRQAGGPRKHSTAWMDRDALEQLKRLSEHKRISQQKLIAEAFNLLFEKHGLPPIAT